MFPFIWQEEIEIVYIKQNHLHLMEIKNEKYIVSINEYQYLLKSVFLIIKNFISIHLTPCNKLRNFCKFMWVKIIYRNIKIWKMMSIKKAITKKVIRSYYVIQFLMMLRMPNFNSNFFQNSMILAIFRNSEVKNRTIFFWKINFRQINFSQFPWVSNNPE